MRKICGNTHRQHVFPQHSHSPKLSLVFLQLNKNMVHFFYFLNVIEEYYKLTVGMLCNVPLRYCNHTCRNKEIEVVQVVLNVKWTCAVNEMTDYIMCFCLHCWQLLFLKKK